MHLFHCERLNSLLGDKTAAINKQLVHHLLEVVIYGIFKERDDERKG